jgi:phosphoribosylformylglycinamidine synthase
LLVGHGAPRLDASQWIGRAEGAPPAPDPAAEAAVCDLVATAAERGLLSSAHDVGGGGVAVALAECAIAGGVGAEVEVPAARRADEALFGEGGGRLVLTCAPERVDELLALAARPVEVMRIGTVGGDAVAVAAGAASARLGLAEAAAAYESAIPGALG